MTDRRATFPTVCHPCDQAAVESAARVCSVSSDEVPASVAEAFVLRAFREQVAKAPTRPAVHTTHGSLSYAELDRRSDRIAHAIRASGTQTGALVGIHLDRTLDLPAAMLGTFKAGCAYLPLDPSHPRQRLHALLTEAQPTLLISTGAGLAALELEPSHPQDTLCLDNLRPLAAPTPAASRTTRVTDDQAAYVIFTSGSTGRPKGVVIGHDTLGNYLQAMACCPGLGPADCNLGLATAAFDMSIFDFFLPLTVGAQLVLGDSDLARDVKRLRTRLEQGDITLLHATPTTLRMLIDAGWQGHPHLKVLSGGEALTRELADAVLARAGALFNGYGPTEGTVCATLFRVQATGPVAIGQPLPHVQAYVLDETQAPVSPGAVGELCLGGACLARGYLRRDALTAERFVPNPFAETRPARMYRTGDLVRLGTDGQLYFVGRIDGQVKIRGHRVELGEIEAVLERVSGVTGAAVVLHTDASSGNTWLAAFYTATKDLSAAELSHALKAQLPAYMVPTTYDPLDELPQSASGKLDRRALPCPTLPQPKAATGPLATNLEREVAAAFTQALGHHAQGPAADFFDMGGSSLQAVQVQQFLERALSREIPLKSLFEGRTVRGVASYLSLEDSGDEPETVAIQPHGTGRPVFCVLGVRHYQPLAEQLVDLERPFFGLHLADEEAAFFAPEADAKQRAEGILRMARRYAAVIRRVQTQGPYTIVGHSTAGIVAVETARVLQAAGEHVDQLIVLDSVLPRGYLRTPAQRLRNRLRLAQRAGLRAELRLALAWTARIATRLHQDPSQTSPSSLRARAQTRLRELHAMHAYESAESYWFRHFARPYDGPLTFVHALERHDVCGRVEATGGWADIARQPIQVLSVPHGHTAMMRTPAVASLAEQLRPQLCLRHAAPNAPQPLRPITTSGPQEPLRCSA